MINKQNLIKKIEAQKVRSAWARGVKAYALELLEGYEGEEIPEKWLDCQARALYQACNLIYRTIQ